MIAKCANPKCEARFLYFGVGRLFVTHKCAKHKPTSEDPVMYPKLFWLCKNCSLHMTLQFDIDGSPVILRKGLPDWENDFPLGMISQANEANVV